MRRPPDAPRSFLVDASGRRLQTYAAHAEPSYVVVDGSGTDPLLRHRRLRSQPLRTNRQTQAPASTQSTRCTHQGPRRPFYFICDRWMQKTRLARVAAAQKLQSLYHKSCDREARTGLRARPRRDERCERCRGLRPAPRRPAQNRFVSRHTTSTVVGRRHGPHAAAAERGLESARDQ